MERSADAILVERARDDLDAGIAHVLRLIGLQHRRAVAVPLEGLVRTGLRTMRVRDAIEHDVRFLLEHAHRIEAGADPGEVADEALPELLRRKRVHLLVREGDPAYGTFVALLRENLVERLPDLGRLARVPAPRDYADVVRRAFPDRAEVERIVAENTDFVHRVVDHVRRHPGVLRIPRGLVGKLTDTASALVDWQVARVKGDVDAIYGA